MGEVGGAAYGVPVETLKKGDVLEIGGVRMEVLHPKDCTGRTSSSTPHWTSGPA